MPNGEGPVTRRLTNPFEAPRRFPYPQNEIIGNAENVPDVTPYNGVWWDDGTED